MKIENLNKGLQLRTEIQEAEYLLNLLDSYCEGETVADRFIIAAYFKTGTVTAYAATDLVSKLQPYVVERLKELRDQFDAL